MLNWQIKHFNDLSLTEFHDLIQLRIKVFVIEQNCPYQELDGKDKKSYHLICRNQKGDLVGTFRILPPGISYNEASIGRVVLDEKYRGTKNGHKMMEEALTFINKEFEKESVRISGQKYLEKFYEKHGFISTGKEYLEDGIPHVEMILKK
jgi:ElaA protein